MRNKLQWFEQFQPGEGLKKTDADDDDDEGVLMENGQKQQRFTEELKLKVGSGPDKF